MKKNVRHYVLKQENLQEIEQRLEYIPKISLRHLVQETRISQSSAKITTKLLKLNILCSDGKHDKYKFLNPYYKYYRSAGKMWMYALGT